MKKRALIAGIFAVLILSLCATIKLLQSTPHPAISAHDITGYLQDGDIICRLGDRFWSAYFKDTSPIDKRFSHLGIARITEGGITVINAEGRSKEGKDSVNETDLDEFLESAVAVGIYRLQSHDGKTLSTAAMEYIGYPFDWNFDLQDDTKLYCTELLYAVLKKTLPEIQLLTIFQKELSKNIIPLEAVSNSEYFKEVAYIKTEVMSKVKRE
jgi:uncharacterized protein YycO